MTKILILGAGGMLGHTLAGMYKHRYETFATIRKNPEAYTRYPVFDGVQLIDGVDAFSPETVRDTIAKIRPAVVINCIGIVKQLPEANNHITSIIINALFPHQVATLCADNGARLIHISTDCVFTGRKGMYTEADVSDAEDLYGRSKFLGEVDNMPNILTLRTSIIGHELNSAYGLIEWFLSQRGKTVKGYRKAIYTGFTAGALGDLISHLIDHHPHLHGLWQASSDPINKYDLLQLVSSTYQTAIEIIPEDTVTIDRSLDSTRLRTTIGYTPPTWEQMVMAMAKNCV
ncbi:MAG: SDR family oxidoreductase [Phototrophicales bacterium]|nr:SDR family oxidoreductase [Phototrophicales bacterium]